MVVTVGVIAKLAALELVPIETPPVGEVNQLMPKPAAVAFNEAVDPEQITLGVAVTNVGVGHCAFKEFIPNAINPIENNV